MSRYRQELRCSPLYKSDSCFYRKFTATEIKNGVIMSEQPVGMRALKKGERLKSNAQKKKAILEHLFCTKPTDTEDYKDRIARFESKWFRERKNRAIEEETDEPSVAHQPPRDNTGDTYFAQPTSKANALASLPVFSYDSDKRRIITL